MRSAPSLVATRSASPTERSPECAPRRADVISAPVVISNADYRRTVTELVAAEHWRPETLAAAKAVRMTLGLICTYVVVDIELPGPNTNYFTVPEFGTPPASSSRWRTASCRTGTCPSRTSRWHRARIPTTHTCVRPGTATSRSWTMAPRGYGWLGVDEGPTHGARYRRDPDYLAAKSELERRMVDAAETVSGPLRDHIVHLETANPRSPTSATPARPRAPRTDCSSHRPRAVRIVQPTRRRSRGCS